MKICLLLGNWGTWGGTAVYHEMICKVLQDCGHDVTVGIPFPEREPWEVPQSLKTAWGLKDCLRELSSSGVWILWHVGTLLDLKAIVKQQKKRPRIISVNHSSSEAVWATRSIKLESKVSNAIVCVSREGLAAIDHDQINKTRIIYPAIDQSRLKPFSTASKMREYLGLEQGDKTLLYLGRICTEKGIEFAIDAVRYLPDQWKLLIVGDCNKKFGLGPLFGNWKVRFCGPTSFPGDYFQFVDCMISPSRSEGFGMSVVEAIASGVPTVAHRVGALKEVEAGTIVSIDCSARDYANAVLVATDDASKSVRDKEAVSCFSCDVFAKQWSQVIDPG